MMRKKPELLSPAGDMEKLKMAVAYGADAVYLAGTSFGMRSFAGNFSPEELPLAVAYAHDHGVRVHVTVNTMPRSGEVDALPAHLERLNDAGVDALILADLGAFTLAGKYAPRCERHISTQQSIANYACAQAWYDLGAKRVVLARELSRRDIAAICRDCPAEVEVFAHGALCMCYSGQCALSAVIGGRSGNRGTCAQPCRLPYGVNAPAAGGHPLSLKDANLSPYLQELEDMGVACLKLEGRMKRPEYVAVIASIYRRLLDEKRRPTREEQRQLELAFSRSGFTDGYYLGRKGPQMFGTRPENVPEPKELFAEARTLYEKEDRRTVAVDMDCVCRAGEPVRLTVRAGDQRAEVTGPVPETARNRALTAEELQARLKKTGGTAFRCREVRVTLEEGLMLSAGAVNALRREGLTALEEVLCAVPERHTAQPEPLPAAPVEPVQPLLTCSLQKPEQLTQALADCRPEMIYLPVEWLDTLDVTPYLDRTSFCAVLPRIFRTEDEAALREMLVRHRQVLAAVAVSNLGHLPIAEGLELPLRGDLGMNVFNSRALLFLRELGLSTAAVSFELRHQQIRDLKKYLPCEAVVYGRLPLMLMENCVIANSLGCCDVGSDYRKRSAACRCTGENVLTDRTGARFPLMPAWGHRNELENSRTLFLADKPEWRRLGLTYARLRFTTESPAECVAALQRYQGQGDYIPADLTRGLFYRGVE